MCIRDRHITTPITEEVTKDLKSGDYVYITGTIYVARDAAHKRMIEALQRGEELPIDIKDSTIYYMGPSPAREGRPIGSAGPTTATRMDRYAPTLLDLGEKAMIGKGKRSKEDVYKRQSSLDETTEKDILDGISHCPDKIIFLITHRKENLRYCNKIYQIRDKRMVSVKNVDELSK